VGEQLKIWLKKVLSADDYAGIQFLPTSTLQLLYPSIFLYGSNGDNIDKFITDVTKAIHGQDKDSYPTYVDRVREANQSYVGVYIPTPTLMENRFRSAASEIVGIRAYILESSVLFTLQLMFHVPEYQENPEILKGLEQDYVQLVTSFGLNPDDYRYKKPV